MSPQNEGFHDEVDWLVGASLKKLEKPYGPNVIEDVYVTIEQHPNLMLTYKQLCIGRDQATVNKAVGHLTRVRTGYKDGRSTPTTRTGLAKTYTILIPPK